MLERAFLLLSLLFSLLTTGVCFAENASPVLSIYITPGLGLPLGDSAGIYAQGGSGGIRAAVDLSLPALAPFLSLRGSFQYMFMQLDIVTTPRPFSDVSGYVIMLGPAATFPLLPWLSLALDGNGGYYIAEAGEPNSAFPAVTDTGFGLSLGTSAYLDLGAYFSLGIRASYEWLIGLYQGLKLDADLALHIPFLAPAAPAGAGYSTLADGFGSGSAEQRPAQIPALEALSVELFDVFPVFYKHYSNHALGRITLKNTSMIDASDVKVSFFVKQYMDNPSLSQVLPLLSAGEEKTIDLFGLFTSNVLEISEPTILSTSIAVEYAHTGQARRLDLTQNVRVQDRNALTWEDDRGAAAFVTAKDPTVLKFGKNVASVLKGKASKALNQPLVTAIGIHEALRAYGLAYVVDPARPFDKMHQNKNAIDFLQFPSQTLDYKAGDCDDLSILYCALLESVNVDTAFITIPGHIYMAFSAGMSPADAQKFFLRPDDLIYTADKSWIPVEVTEREGDLLKAWDEGAREWRENLAQGRARILPLEDCWQGFEAVGFSGTLIALSMPAETTLVNAFTREVNSFVTREISSRASSLNDEIRGSKDPTKPMNKLGILYAQFGQYDLAEQQFSPLAAKDYVPALINLGNIFYARNDLRKSLSYYQKAQTREPDNEKALLYIARVNHELENYGEVKLAYDALSKLNPSLASRFSYLDLRGDEATRAADLSQVKSIMLWEGDK
jgi:tetratricopeptide (TPR) repeat protein